MIEMKVLSAPFACRTKELLWYRETKQCIELLRDGKSLDDIKELSQKENIFNAASSSRANNIRVVKVINDKTNVEVLSRQVIIDLPFTDDFGFGV